MTKAVDHAGFAFIEIMSQCPVHYGKLSGEGKAVAMMRIMEERSVPLRQANGMAPQELAGRWVVGELAGGTDEQGAN